MIFGEMQNSNLEGLILSLLVLVMKDLPIDIVLYGDPGNWGRNDSISAANKWGVFIQKLNNHIDKMDA